MPRGRSDYEAAKISGRVWTPATEAGRFFAWWDAGHDATRVLSGSNVTTWKDRLGKVNDLTQATSTSRPTFNQQYVMGGIRGLPAFVFDGGDNLNGSITITGIPLLVVVVASFGDGSSVPASSGRLCSVFKTSDGYDWQTASGAAVITKDGANTAVRSDRNNSNSTAVSVTTHTPTIFASRFDGAQGQIGLNGADITPSTGALSFNGDGFIVGAGLHNGVTGALPWIGPVWEVVVTTDQSLYERIAGYLAFKLWTSGNNPLPAAHRYKNCPPLIGA